MYIWIVIVGGIFSFFAAMGIGANDVANAFATSVGSKALTMKQAVILAAIFETAGAVLMGNRVTDTIRKGIADYKCFEEQPDILMYGCMWVVLSVGLWLFIASYYEMPVSTTHSCVGGMIGMTIALAGSDCVIWYKPSTTFPYVGGVSGIVLSWFLSPFFSMLIAIFIYFITRAFVLRHNFTSKRINWIYPILIGTTMTINSFFIIYKGAKGLGLHNTPVGIAIGISFGVGGFSAIVTIPLVPYLKKYVTKKLVSNKDDIELSNTEQIAEKEKEKQFQQHISLKIKNKKELDRVIKIHTKAEKFDPKTEEVFKYLQIFTAICGSFGHGANDVANAIGPFSVIYIVYISGGDLMKKNDLETNAYWILGMGGIGISVGLFVY